MSTFLCSHLLTQIHAMKNQPLSLSDMSLQTHIIGFLHTKLKNIESKKLFEIGVMIVNGGITGKLRLNEIIDIIKTADQLGVITHLAFNCYPNLEIHINNPNLEDPKISKISETGDVIFEN